MGTIKKNFAYNLILTVSNIAFPVITFPYASRVLGPIGIGKVQFVSTFIQYFVLISALGIPIYGIREIAKSRNNSVQLSKVFSELLMLNFFTGFGLFIIYFLVVYLVPDLRNDLPFYQIASLMLLLGFCNIDWFFSGMERFKFIALRSVFIKVAAIFFLFFIVRTGSDDLNYLWITILITVVNNLINLWAARKIVNFKLVNIKSIFKHLKPLLLIFSTVAAISIYALLDTIFLGFIKGYGAVGYYTSGTKISKLAIPVLTSLGMVLIPRIAQSFKEDKLSEVKSLVGDSLSLVILMGLPMTIGLMTLAPELVMLFSGEKFVNAILPMQIFTPVVLLIGISNVYAIQVLTPAGKDKYVTVSVVIGLVVSLILNFILIPKLSYIGAAITNLISEFVVMIFFIHFTNKVIKFKFDILLFTKSLIICLSIIPIASLFRYLFSNNPLIIILLTGSFFCTFYVLFQLFVFKVDLFVKQKNSILNMINKSRK